MVLKDSAMRDLSNDTRLLSLNTATVKVQWDLKEIIDNCVKLGIGGISPWRDKAEKCGLQ